MKQQKWISNYRFEWLFIAVAMGVLLNSGPARALPPYFISETVKGGFNSPIDIEFAPHGLVFVAELPGIVKVIADGQLLTQPFIDISSQCNLSENRGLLGIAVHPDFPAMPYVYLNYTYDPPQTAAYSGMAGRDGDGQRVSRLSRVTADVNNGFVTAVPGSEVVLVGNQSSWANIANPSAAQEDNSDGWTCYENHVAFGTPVQDCMPADGRSHSVGAVEFGTDGSLFFSNGDGSSFVIVDPRALRSLDLDSLAGKIMRIDPITGEGLSDNPFYNGNPNSNRSKIYDLGLRNPYRFTIDPYTNIPWIGDVGWATWEEINSGRGQDFGWPCYEGGNSVNLRTGGYEELAQCSAYYANNSSVTPAISWNRSGAGGAALAGPIYTASAYPADFADARFYADYVQGWIKYQTPGGQIFDFAANIPALVDLELGPDGNLYYLEFLSGTLKRFVYDTESAGQSFSASLRSVNSDQCVSVPDGSNVDGTQLVQAGCSGMDGQVFDFRPATGGYSIVVGSNGKCLDISGGQTSSAAALIQWTCHGGDNQVFQLVEQTDGSFEIIADHSGQCIDISGGSTDTGALLIQWPCHGNPNQRWYLDIRDTNNQPPVLVTPNPRDDTLGSSVLIHLSASDPDGDALLFSATGLPPDLQLRPRVGEIGGPLLQAGTFNVMINVSDSKGGSDTASFQWIVRPASGNTPIVGAIVSAHSDKCIDINGASTSPGAKAIQWLCHQGQNQQFNLQPFGSTYQIASVNSGLCLQPNGASTSAGAQLEQAVCADSASQRFDLVPSNDYYEIISQGSNLCLDIAGASTSNGTSIIQWPCHGHDNQLWHIESNGAAIP